MDHEDQAWRYHERPCIGFLSAAAWQCGGVSLEEWRTDKGPKKQPNKGRCDLYVYHRRQEFFIEAKHLFCKAAGLSKRQLSKIEEKLDRAAKDAAKLRCVAPQQRLGILFLVPFYPPGELPKNYRKQIAGWIRHVTTIPCSAMAWVYECRQQSQSDHAGGFPGIILLARTPR